MSILKDKYALVTGASSGLGVDFAQILAERGCHLILVARREDELRKVKEKIVAENHVQVHVIPMDLSVQDAAQSLYDRVKAIGISVDVLINNAGFGVYGNFVEIAWEKERQMLQLDIMTLVHLTKLFLKDMVARNFGYILQVSSIGAYQSTPTYATYAAAKSFVLSFGEAVSYELRNTNVKMTVLSPGVTETEFLKVSGQKLTLYQKMMMMKSRPVAEIGIDKMLQGSLSVVPGFGNALATFLARFTPRKMQVAMAQRAMKP